jgi:hypothetical protein
MPTISSPTYVSGTEFTKAGNQTAILKARVQVLALQGVDGSAESEILSASYSAGPNLTTCILTDSILTANLATIETGFTDPASLCGHDHPEIPASVLTSGDITVLDGIPGLTGVLIGKNTVAPEAVAADAACEYLRRNVANSAYEFESLQFLRTGTAGETLAQYNVVYTKTTDSGKCWKAQADGTEEERDAWGMVLESGGIAAAGTGAILHTGFVTNGSWTWTPGAKLYLSDTAGGLTETEPTNAVVLAHAVTATTILFIPGTGGGSASSGTSIKHVTTDAALAALTSVGEPLHTVGTVAGWGQARASSGPGSSSNAQGSCGIVESISGNDVTIVTCGEITGLSGFTAATLYYISPDIYGALVTADPRITNPQAESRPILYALTTTTGIVIQSREIQNPLVTPARYATASRGNNFYKTGNTTFFVPWDYYYYDSADSALRWDCTPGEIDVANAYVAATTGGILGGKIANSWYSVWLVSGASASYDVMLLPLVRIKTIAFSTDTTITLADHDTGASEENGFLTATGAWDGFLLTKPDFSVGYNLDVSTSGSPDTLVFTGVDVTDLGAVGDFLLLKPAQDIEPLYLGILRIDGSGNIRNFLKDGQSYTFPGVTVAGVTHATTEGNTSLVTAISPFAKSVSGYTIANSGANSSDRVSAELFWGTSGTDVFQENGAGQQAVGAYMQDKSPFFKMPVSVGCLVRNLFRYWSGATGYAADTGDFVINGFEDSLI